MKKLFIGSCMVLFVLLSHAQDTLPKHWVSVNLGSQMTDLNFTSANGNELNYTNRLNFINGIGYSFMTGGLVLDLNIDYYTLSASYQDDNVNTSIKLGYLQPAINVGYVFRLDNFPFNPRIGAGYGHGILINGDQLTNGTLTDIKQAETLKKTDAGLNLNAGVMVFNKSGISMTAMYNYRFGLSNIENATNNQETTTSIHALHIKIQLAL